MRCKIMCVQSDCYDIATISKELAKDGYTVSYELVSDLDQMEPLLRQQPFDLVLIASGNADLLLASQLLGDIFLPYKVTSLFMMKEFDEDLRLQLMEMGVSRVITDTKSDKITATVIDLLLQKERARSELASMGGFMRDASLIFDPDGDTFRIFFANKAFLSFDRLKSEDIVGKMIGEIEGDFNLQAFSDDINEVFATGVPLHMPNYYCMKEGMREWFDVYIYKPNHEQVSLIASPQTEIKRTHDKAEASRRYLQTILNAQSHIIYITDGTHLINSNKAFLDFFGFSTLHDFAKRYSCVTNLFEESDQEGYIDGKRLKWLDEVAENPKAIYKIRIKKDETMAVFIPSVQTIEIDDKKQFVVILTDISELEFEKEKMRVVAMTDQLTGAANRLMFNTVIDEQVAVSRRYGTALSVILFDVDHFKRINDSYSHQVGDQVLKSIASIIRGEIRESDLFIRWGGEEFMILLPNTSLGHAQIVAEKIRYRFENFDFERVGRVTCSFGCATLAPEVTVPMMISRADEAMYQAKKAGRNCTRSFHE